MKKGDIVTIKDSSYSKVVTDGGLKSGYGGSRSVRDKQGTIIELDCVFSDLDKYQKLYNTFNNTVVVLDSGKVVFIEERFLELVPPTHKIMVGIYQTQSGCVMLGDIVEISDKLYKEIKRDSQS